MLDFYLSFPVIILMIIGITALIYFSVFGLKNYRKIINYQNNKLNDLSEINANSLPKASIIVYAHKCEGIIREFLKSILTQNYPNFEIIVVNDYTKDDMTQEIVENLCKSHSNLHITYVPQDSRNVSRKKLAITLGIKAAKGDVIITTTANCKIKSDMWLKLMMQHFNNNEIDIVLGYSHTNKKCQKGLWKWYRSFDSTTTATQWLGNAINKKAYRGDGFNLAYRKSIFFNNKGFAKTIHLQNGEDDLFINQISSPTNTAVEIQESSQLIVDWGENERHIWLDMKEQYTFTSKYLHTKAFFWQKSYDISLWIGFVTLITSSIISLPNIIPTLISLALLIGHCSVLIYTYRKTASKLNTTKLFWSLPIFILFKPIINWCYKLRFNTRKSNNFTWQRQKQK